MSSNLVIITGDFKSRLAIPFITGGIKAGFPSPAQDYMSDSLDFNHDIIRHPESTFYARVKGDSMIDAGICDGDIVVVDRSIEAVHGDIIVAYIDGEFTIKYLDLAHKEDGYILLVPANKHYEPIKLFVSDPLVIWGVVAWTIKKRPGNNPQELP